MNPYLLLAGLLMFVIGVVHSLLGERLVFRRLRGSGWLPEDPAGPLRKAQLRILWATWPAASLQGWGIAAVLIHAAQSPVPAPVLHALMLATAGSGLLVLLATRGRHPGWVPLLAVALLLAFGSR